MVHCGDLGHPLSTQQRKALGHVDVLLLPVGGFYTIGPAEAKQVMEQLEPRLTVPMHFKTPSINFPIETVEPFLHLVGEFEQAGSMTIEVGPADLEARAQIIVLDYPR